MINECQCIACASPTPKLLVNYDPSIRWIVYDNNDLINIAVYTSLLSVSQTKSESTEVDGELKQLSQGISFRDLTNPSTSQQRQPLTNALCEIEEEGKLPTTPPLPVAGQCSHRLQFKMASTSPTTGTLGVAVGRRSLSHCRSVSQKWLERCKPDLSKFEADPLEPSCGEEESDSGGETDKMEEEEAEVMEESGENGGDEGEVESLGEAEEEVWQQQEKGEEFEAWQKEEHEMKPQQAKLNICDHDDDNKDHCSSPHELTLNPLSRYEGLEVEESSWGDNSDASSNDDSSSGDDPLINACLGEQFEKKWGELSNSVKTLSPLKLLPTRSPHKSSNIKTSKKNFILAPRSTRHLVSVGKICTDNSSSKTPFHENSQIEEEVLTEGGTGLLHLRDSLTLLELYGSKDLSTTVQANTQSLVSLLLNRSELTNGCPSKDQRKVDSGKRSNKWKLLPSARARNFVNVVPSSILKQTSDGSSSQNPPSVSDLPQTSRSVLPPPPQLINSTQLVKDAHCQPTNSKTSVALTPPSASANISSSLDSGVRESVDEGDRSGHPAKAVDLDIESDLGLLSRDPCVVRNTESSVVGRRRSLRRGRGQVHSAAAVLSEVELKDGEKTRAMDTHGDPASGSVNHSGSSSKSNCPAVQVEERMTTNMEGQTR